MRLLHILEVSFVGIAVNVIIEIQANFEAILIIKSIDLRDNILIMQSGGVELEYLLRRKLRALFLVEALFQGPALLLYHRHLRISAKNFLFRTYGFGYFLSHKWLLLFLLENAVAIDYIHLRIHFGVHLLLSGLTLK